MAVFKRKRSGKDGKVDADGVWTVQITDHTDVRRRIPGFASRAASAELERNIRKLISIRQAGGSLDAESNRFLETAPAAVRDKLAAWGVIEKARAAMGKPLSEHIADWRLALEAKGNCVDHVKQFTSNIRRLADACGWRNLTDISATDVTVWISARRKESMSAGTINHHLRAGKAFCNWAIEVKRLTENSLKYIPLLNADTDRRVERHPYTVEELGALLTAAERGPIVNGMAGSDRVLLYRTAVETGFRWSELHSLMRISFNFEAEPATVTIRAEDSKNGKEDTLPLRPELAADLKARMALFLPTAKAFPGMWQAKGAAMIRVDLEAAGIIDRDANGNLITTDDCGLSYDFHGLRHTFATLGAKAGIPLAVMQKLMRHSDPKLTAGIYTHVLVADKADELAKLPEIAPAVLSDQMVGKTGTDDSSFLQVRNSMDTSRDTYALDFDGKIRSYVESKKPGLAAMQGRAETQKSPVSQGETGLLNSGDHDGTRTRNLQIDSLVL